MRGAGILSLGAESVGSVDYELDGYLLPPGGIAASGEIRAEPGVLKQVFGCPDLQLVTKDGRCFGLRFSEKTLGDEENAAHVDVISGLPEAKNWRP